LPVLHRYFPQPQLAAFVEAIYLYQGDTPQHTKERRLPDGSMELVINLHEDTIRVYDREHPNQVQNFSGCVLGGAHSEFSIIDTATLVSTIGVHFKAGGAFPFLPLPATELSNEVIDLSTLWGDEAVDLREQLLVVDEAERKFHILEQFLLARMGALTFHHPAVSYALKVFQTMDERRSIAEVTEELGLSQKRFIQVFSEAVGLTPKLFCRVLRFQDVLRRLEKDEPVDWMDIALDCGYYDQAHFNHDFQAFSGLTPGSYLVQRSEFRNHVPLSNC
jgi:AraC-like DNA-binding protein